MLPELKFGLNTSIESNALPSKLFRKKSITDAIANVRITGELYVIFKFIVKSYRPRRVTNLRESVPLISHTRRSKHTTRFRVSCKK